MISVCFRFDDPSATSDHELERRVLDIFARHRVPLCVAAIPFGSNRDGGAVFLSSDNAAHLIDATRTGLIEIAQHGHSHIDRASSAQRTHSEFSGVPAAEQLRLVTEGAIHLTTIFGQRIKGFVPPWNTYDRATAEAVDAAGFEFLSAGMEVINAGKLAVVPRTCTLRDARDTLERALCFRALAPVVVVVFHPDDFQEFRLPPCPDEPPPFTNLGELESLLEWIEAKSTLRPEHLSVIADSVRKGMPLRDPRELRLPWRIKSLVPPMLARSTGWAMMAGVLWGAFRTRCRLDG